MAAPRNATECAHCQSHAFEALCSDYASMRELIKRSPLVLEDANISLRNMTGQVVCPFLIFPLVCQISFDFVGAFIGGWHLCSLPYGVQYRCFSYRLLSSFPSLFPLLPFSSLLLSRVQTCPQMGWDQDRRRMGRVHCSGKSLVFSIISASRFLIPFYLRLSSVNDLTLSMPKRSTTLLAPILLPWIWIVG